MRTSLGFALLVAAACSTTGKGNTDAAGSGSNAAVMCTGSDPTFPTFDDSCNTVSDCAIADHQINCCGSRDAIGISTTAVGAFNTAEAICDGQYPPCGCAQSPTTAQDGKTSAQGTIMVACTNHACTTFVQ
jgi:hypothetical protein